MVMASAVDGTFIRFQRAAKQRCHCLIRIAGNSRIGLYAISLQPSDHGRAHATADHGIHFVLSQKIRQSAMPGTIR